MKARKNLRQVSNLKHSDPSNIPLRQHYHEGLNNFKKLMKSKKQKFHSDILAELETTQENTNFWKVVNSAEEFTESKIPHIPEEKNGLTILNPYILRKEQLLNKLKLRMNCHRLEKSRQVLDEVRFFHH